MFGNWLFCVSVIFKAHSLTVVFDYFLLNFVGVICFVISLGKKERTSKTLQLLHDPMVFYGGCNLLMLQNQFFL